MTNLMRDTQRLIQLDEAIVQQNNNQNNDGDRRVNQLDSSRVSEGMNSRLRNRHELEISDMNSLHMSQRNIPIQLDSLIVDEAE